MVRKRVTLEGFARELETLSPALKGAVTRGLRSAALRLEGMVKEEIELAQPFPAVDRGELKASVTTVRHPDGANVEVQAPHAAIIEDGTRPFRPPLAPLIAWASRKFGANEREAKRIAWAVADKIASNGIAPRHYFEKAWVRVQPEIAKEIRRELEQLAKRR